MNSSFKPFIIAVVIAVVFQTITYFLPDIPEEYADQGMSETTQILTGSSNNETLIENIEKDLQIDAYLRALPFSVEDKDKEELLKHAQSIATALSKNDKESVENHLKKIEDILHPYWFKEKTKKHFLAFELYEDFMIQKDYDRLKAHMDRIMDMKDDKTTGELFKEMSLFIDDYYTSLNNILDLYRKEIIEKKLIVVEVLSDNHIKKMDQLTKKPAYDYTTFLLSRAFAISDKDMNDLYYVYADLKSTGSDQYYKSLENTMAPYWIEKSTVDTFIPLNIYKSTVYGFLSEEQLKEIDQQYKHIEDTADINKIPEHIQSMIQYNHALRNGLTAEYNRFEELYNLRRLIEDVK